MNRIAHIDSLEFMKLQKDFDTDLVYCDPPYALGSEVIVKENGKVDYNNASDFMNKWEMPTGDYWESWFKESFRTLKHGGYCIMFGMDRQLLLFKYYAHLAGFTEKQSMYWYFISNFPKATDLSKMIDKNAGAEREFVRENPFKASEEAEIRSAGKSQSGRTTHPDITAPSTPLAKKYSGYKYSIAPLKQTNETILIFCKPTKTGSVLHDTLAMENGDESITCGALDIERNKIPTNNEEDPSLSSFGGKLSSLPDIHQFYEKHSPSFVSLPDFSDRIASGIHSYNKEDKDHSHSEVYLNDNLKLVVSCNLTTQDFLSNVKEYVHLSQEVQDFLNDYPVCRRLYDELLREVQSPDQALAQQQPYALSYIYSILPEPFGNRGSDIFPLSNSDAFLLLMTLYFMLNSNISYYIKSTTETQGRHPSQTIISSQVAEVLDEQGDVSKILHKCDFTETELDQILITKQVETRVDRGGWDTKQRYKDLGYEIPERKTKNGIRTPYGTTIWVNVWDLPDNSILKVSYYCIYCGDKDTKPWRDLLGRDDMFRCNHCAKTKFMTGEQNHKYDKSITDEEREIKRRTPEYKEWRKNVYERDNYICQRCSDNVGGNLIAHHIIPFSKNKVLRTILENGITLCQNCHNEFHSKHSKNNFSVNDFHSWLFSPRNDFEKEEHDLYIYCPKVSKSERNAGCEEMEEKRYHERGCHKSSLIEHPPEYKLKNNHPTLKPISLNEKVLKLFKTPNPQKILIPFCGSGSEIIGAIKAGFTDWSACELSEEYITIAEARIEHWRNNQVSLF